MPGKMHADEVVTDPSLVRRLPADQFPQWPGRKAFRSAIEVDDATRARGRGWALLFALIALPYYMHTNPCSYAMPGT
jgi:aminoglycoside phosphotransferase (APT) family kinase protein